MEAQGNGEKTNKNMCLYPKLITNRKYTSNKKNGGIIPAVSDKRTLLVPVGCQKCIECKKLKSREWSVRLQEDIKHHTNGHMVTLTMSNESYTELYNIITKDYTIEGYELDNQIATLAVRRFLERWRKKHKKSLRHWLITELGGNGHECIHLHGIIYTNEPHNIEKYWKYGYIHIGEYVNETTINYIVKYVHKTDQKHPNYTSKILTSAGIGNGYTKQKNFERNKYNGKNTIETYQASNGANISLPIYYRNKLYTDEEKEKLWLNKLDKNIRYVCGEEIDINKGEEQYYNKLNYYRKLNKRLGYGDNSKNWEKAKYELQRRKLKQKERLKKNNR